MLFVGDCHSKFKQYKKIIKPHKESIQLGDFGIGFPGYKPVKYRDGDKFIRGNHDNPEVCQSHPNYLGDFGMYKNIFFCSGGFSIDRAWRTQDVDWWRDEELSMEQSYQALELYEKSKPEIVISHQCPQFIECNLFDFRHIPNRTIQLLQGMLDIHKPKLWVFGHYHMSRDEDINGCRYVCLNELESKVIDI